MYRRESELLKFISALALLLLLFIFQLTNFKAPETFLGFTSLKWEEQVGCSTQKGPDELNPNLAAVSTSDQNRPLSSVKCQSQWTTPHGNTLEIEYAGYPNFQGQGHGIYLETKSNQKTSLHLLSIPKCHPAVSWKYLRLDLTKYPSTTNIRFVLKDASDGKSWIAMRSRISHYQSTYLIERLISYLETEPANTIVLLILSVFLALALRDVIFLRTKSTAIVFITFVVIAIGIHFRTQVFFHEDEWHLLERLRDYGPKALLIAHNEHLMPLFILLYWIETKLFGSFYESFVLVSIALHSLNTILLISLLRRLGAHLWGISRGAYAVGFLYLISGLQSESIHWVMAQGPLLSITFSLTAMLVSYRYGLSGKLRYLLLSFVFMFCAPFCAANAFVLPLEVLVLFFMLRRTKFANALTNSDKAVFKQRFCRLALVSFLVFTTAGVIYYTHRVGAGHGVSHAGFSEHASDILPYTALGSQFGTVVRGLGLYPHDGFQEFSKVVNRWVPSSFDQIVLASSVGILLSTLLLIPSLFSKRHSRDIQLLWFIGQIIIMLSLLLPAFGRARFGILWSLVLRYQSSALIGLSLAVLPTACALCRYVYTHPSRKTLWRSFVGKLVALLLVAHIWSQLSLSQSYSYYWRTGRQVRDFSKKVHNWKSVLKKAAPSKDLSFEATGTEHAGLQPLFYKPAPKCPRLSHHVIHPDSTEEIFRGL